MFRASPFIDFLVAYSPTLPAKDCGIISVADIQQPIRKRRYCRSKSPKKMSGKAERVVKRSRRLSTDSDDKEEEYDWSDRRQRPETAGRPSTRGRAASGAE